MPVSSGRVTNQSGRSGRASGMSCERDRGDGQVLQQGRGVGRRRVRLRRRAEHERLHRDLRSSASSLVKLRFDPHRNSGGSSVARDDGAAERARHVLLVLVALHGLDDRVGDLLGGHRLGPLPVVRVAARLAEVGGDRSRLHHRHADAVGLELHDQRLGEPDAGELRRRVDRLERRAQPPGDRPERDDVAPAPLDHPGHDEPDRVRGAEHVHPDDPLDLLRGDVGERPVLPDPRVGHEDVRRPDLRPRARASAPASASGSATSATAIAPWPPTRRQHRVEVGLVRAMSPTVGALQRRRRPRPTAAPDPRRGPRDRHGVAPRPHCMRRATVAATT